MATKYPTTGPKPVDNGRLGGNPSGFTPSGGLGGAVSPWATPGTGGYTIGAERPPDTLPFMRHDDPRSGFGGVPGSGPATASQIGLGTTGGLQSLFNQYSALGGATGGGGLGGGGMGVSAPAPPPAGNWQQANGGTQQGMGYGLAPAPRTGIQLGNRGAQKRMGRTQLGMAPSESGLGEAPGGSSAPAAAPSMPGITGDPGPAVSGLQSLLARARQISPWAKGF